jgi:hypothetical protein
VACNSFTWLQPKRLLAVFGSNIKQKSKQLGKNQSILVKINSIHSPHSTKRECSTFSYLPPRIICNSISALPRMYGVGLPLSPHSTQLELELITYPWTVTNYNYMAPAFTPAFMLGV